MKRPRLLFLLLLVLHLNSITTTLALPVIGEEALEETVQKGLRNGRTPVVTINPNPITMGPSTRPEGGHPVTPRSALRRTSKVEIHPDPNGANTPTGASTSTGTSTSNAATGASTSTSTSTSTGKAATAAGATSTGAGRAGGTDPREIEEHHVAMVVKQLLSDKPINPGYKVAAATGVGVVAALGASFALQVAVENQACAYVKRQQKYMQRIWDTDHPSGLVPNMGEMRPIDAKCRKHIWDSRPNPGFSLY